MNAARWKLLTFFLPSSRNSRNNSCVSSTRISTWIFHPFFSQSKLAHYTILYACLTQKSSPFYFSIRLMWCLLMYYTHSPFVYVYCIYIFTYWHALFLKRNNGLNFNLLRTSQPTSFLFLFTNKKLKAFLIKSPFLWLRMRCSFVCILP